VKNAFELSQSGRRGYLLPKLDVPSKPTSDYLPSGAMRTKPASLPELSEIDVVRLFTYLSTLNYGVETGFYPLGSCTMKYNPKLNEDTSSLPGFANLHPYTFWKKCPGMLELLWTLDQWLCELTGMARYSLQPAAGAHGELAGMKIVYAAQKARGQNRTVMLIPDSAHGTNPASAAMTGFSVRAVATDQHGNIDLADLAAKLDNTIAGIMITNPNTLGLFEEHILEVSAMVHQAGALLYYDGANANAILGICRPSDMGFDICHLNLHKTFSTPHGGGGPGSGPVGVVKELVPFLPLPTVEKDEHGHFFLDYDRPQSIGRLRAFYGNVLVAVRAYTYLAHLGRTGVVQMSRDAVLAANYLAALVRDKFNLSHPQRIPKHEFVISCQEQAKAGFKALDISKRLLDKGFHAPTTYFPLIVPEALMIEPTETEPIETLEAFANALLEIDAEGRQDPEMLHQAPQRTPVRRLDEVGASRNLVVVEPEG